MCASSNSLRTKCGIGFGAEIIANRVALERNRFYDFADRRRAEILVRHHFEFRDVIIIVAMHHVRDAYNEFFVVHIRVNNYVRIHFEIRRLRRPCTSTCDSKRLSPECSSFQVETYRAVRPTSNRFRARRSSRRDNHASTALFAFHYDRRDLRERATAFSCVLACFCVAPNNGDNRGGISDANYPSLVTMFTSVLAQNRIGHANGLYLHVFE